MPGISLNGDIYSWNSHELLIEVFKVRGATGLDFSESLDSQGVQADNQDGTNVGETYGTYKVETISLRVLRSYTAALLAYLTTLGLGSYGSARFTMTSKLFEPALNPIPVITTFSNCRVIGKKDSREKGSGELITEFSVYARTLNENGQTLYDQTRGLL